MDYMFEAGFLGTRAPFFMDFVMIIVAFLPLLTLGAIALAKINNYKLHTLTQTIIFIVSVIVVGYFEYGVRAGGGFDAFMKESHTSDKYALWVLIFHIIVATLTLVVWIRTLLLAYKEKRNHKLPGAYSITHQKAGKLTFIGIFLTSFTGVWVYILLFVY